MVQTLAILIPLLVMLMVATAGFGADSPGLALFLSAGFLVLGAVAVWVNPRLRLSFAMGLALWGGAVVLLGQLLGPSPAEALPDITVLLAAGAVYLAMSSACSRPAGTELVVKLLSGAIILVSLVSFIDFVSSPETVYGQAKAYHQDRLTAAFLSANTAATLFGMFTLFGLAGLMRVLGTGGIFSLFDRNSKGVIISLLVLIFSVTCLMLTGSRGGLAATLVAGAGLVFWTRRGKDTSSKLWIPVLGFVIIAGGLMALSSSVLGDRLAGTGIDDTGRSMIWAVSWQAFLDAPLFGHGFGQFGAAIAPHITLETAPVLSQQGAAHNLFLQWLVQAGVVGAAGGAAILIAALWPLARGLRRRRRHRGVMKAVSAIAALVVLHGLLDYAVEIPALVWWFAVFLGIGAGVAAGEKTPSSAHREKKKRRTVTL